jgi:hypothetical protein
MVEKINKNEIERLIIQVISLQVDNLSFSFEIENRVIANIYIKDTTRCLYIVKRRRTSSLHKRKTKKRKHEINLS